MWWLTDSARLKAEDAAIDELLAREPWLAAAKKRLAQDMKFAIDFDIVLNGETLPFTLDYPAHFPHTPPSVIPRDSRHYSGHQYGNGGELCLEFRADNWHPSITGAMMIESAYRLLAGEQPGPGQRADVPSAHQVSLGQQLRGISCRFLVTAGLRDFAVDLSPGNSRPCRILEIVGPNSTWVAYVHSIGSSAAPEWIETVIPASAGDAEDGHLYRVECLPSRTIADQASLEAAISAPISRWIVLADASSAQLYLSFPKDGNWTVIPYRTVDLTTDPGRHLPDSYAFLANKTVGLVGCGSLGSKIATTLARSGVAAFVLADDDILKPGNLVRNDLDAGAVGSHKADALAARLKAVAPNVHVAVHRVMLGGQEASVGTASVLDALAKCDLLIDASVDPRAFNFAGAAARSGLRPMIWAEVYAGGIGGFVARLRPHIEPPPHTARRQYLAWCNENGVPWQAGDVDYGSRGTDREALVADDADVAVIAAHAAKMAIDVLIRPEQSAFPHSAYVIGLGAGWIFTQPFDTRPFDFTLEDEWRPPISSNDASDAVDYLLSILTLPDDASRTGT